MSRIHETSRRAGSAGAPATGAAVMPAIDPISEELLLRVETIQCRMSPDALIVDPRRAGEPLEEFRTLRTRLNHMQGREPIHTILMTSASPAEGKSFSAVNLALAQAQLEGNRTLLCDFDLRRPVIHKLFQTGRGPGVTDYLQGRVPLEQAMRRIGDSNLYVMPAGEPVPNPLELLNLPQVKHLLDRLPELLQLGRFG